MTHLADLSRGELVALEANLLSSPMLEVLPTVRQQLKEVRAFLRCRSNKDARPTPTDFRAMEEKVESHNAFVSELQRGYDDAFKVFSVIKGKQERKAHYREKYMKQSMLSAPYHVGFMNCIRDRYPYCLHFQASEPQRRYNKKKS